jgi:hypothetical protein|tara:strand:- start:5235 stop:5501 length:267 start_codon:yes stop_codon:yes gene_type:complete
MQVDRLSIDQLLLSELRGQTEYLPTARLFPFCPQYDQYLHYRLKSLRKRMYVQQMAMIKLHRKLVANCLSHPTATTMQIFIAKKQSVL